jgi:hypothetical protein
MAFSLVLVEFLLVVALLLASAVDASCTQGIAEMPGGSFNMVMDKCVMIYNATEPSYIAYQFSCNNDEPLVQYWSGTTEPASGYGCAGVPYGAGDPRDIWPDATFPCGSCAAYIEMRLITPCNSTDYMDITMATGCTPDVDTGTSQKWECTDITVTHSRYTTDITCSGANPTVTEFKNNVCNVGDGSEIEILHCGVTVKGSGYRAICSRFLLVLLAAWWLW